MYRIIKGIHIHFAHHVRGHRGACISVHGHTWMFEVTLAAGELDAEGFVRDFADLRREVLEPCHKLLDHSLAIGADTWGETREALTQLGDGLVASREVTMGHRGERQEGVEDELAGARNEFPGDIKVSVFPFAPTSERLAEWLYHLAVARLTDERVHVVRTRVYETLHPTESIAEYEPG
jgi:6-pyruvoyl-tetrahydropterin synthase